MVMVVVVVVMVIVEMMVVVMMVVVMMVGSICAIKEVIIHNVSLKPHPRHHMLFGVPRPLLGEKINDR